MVNDGFFVKRVSRRSDGTLALGRVLDSLSVHRDRFNLFSRGWLQNNYVLGVSTLDMAVRINRINRDMLRTVDCRPSGIMSVLSFGIVGGALPKRYERSITDDNADY